MWSHFIFKPPQNLFSPVLSNAPEYKIPLPGVSYMYLVCSCFEAVQCISSSAPSLHSQSKDCTCTYHTPLHNTTAAKWYRAKYNVMLSLIANIKHARLSAVPIPASMHFTRKGSNKMLSNIGKGGEIIICLDQFLVSVIILRESIKSMGQI